MDPKIVTFTGGLGAQIISAAAYYYVQSTEGECFADTSYFDQPPRIAQPGQGGVSHWAWELGCFALERSHFKYCLDYKNTIIISDDNPEKGTLSRLGLQVQAIRDLFPISAETRKEVMNIVDSTPYTCFHLRRGDYLNVASHIVSDDSVLRLAQRLARYSKLFVIVSDTPISASLIERLKKLPTPGTLLTGGSTPLAHAIMRLSEILVCSNSQLSFTAAMLRDERRLSFLPSRYNSGDQGTNKSLAAIREYQVLTL